MIRNLIALAFLASPLFAQGLVFPGKQWTQTDPARFGWSSSHLAAAKAHAEGLESNVMVVHRGALIAAWGDVDERHAVQSVRKSFLSALIGIAVAEKKLDPNATLADLKIDDRPPLTPREKRARVTDLLTSRSGIYHSALYEHPSWKKRKPARGAHAPGSFWFYNNWDFNALGTIYERATRTTIGDSFERRIAKPIGMEDFRPDDVEYLTRTTMTERFMENESDHRAYVFSMTARDMARFGLLYLANGRWNGRQIVPASWVQQSTRAIVPTPRGASYGYMWWARPAGDGLPPMVFASGAGGQRIFVIPQLQLVVVHQVPSGGVGLFAQLRRRFFGSQSVEDEELAKLLQLIVAAHPRR
ncbi:MAG TPA: serine hydrolase [Thermoanaerobaculia bacterium]|nr:serine hydrolase [Thermoanaerobaculia bacterium]